MLPNAIRIQKGCAGRGKKHHKYITIEKIRLPLIFRHFGALTLSALGSGVEADVPFAFRIGDRDLPAGNYSFVYKEQENAVVVRGGKAEVSLPVKTRLHGPSGALDLEGTRVFDRKGEIRLLSEVRMPREDGLQVGALPDAQAHTIVQIAQRSADMASGSKIFQQTCQVCHGPEGKCDPAADQFFHKQLPRLNSAYVQDKSDDDLRETISQGTGRMDPVRLQEPSGVRHKLPASAIDPAIACVRTLGRAP